MIKIAEAGNTILRIATSGVEVKGGTKWTVYPELVTDPTLQKFTPDQQSREGDLRVTGFREQDDLSDHGMNRDLAAAVAQLRDNLGLDRYKDLGLVANQIEVDPKGEIAQILEKEYGIKPLEKEGQAPAEIKG